MVPGGEGQEPWVPIAKAQLKKQTKMFQAEKRKRESQAKAAVDKDQVFERQVLKYKFFNLLKMNS